MKIWKLSFYSNDPQIYFFESKAGAKAKCRELCEEAAEAGDPVDDAKVEQIEVNPTRRGIAAALNQIVYLTAYNEN